VGVVLSRLASFKEKALLGISGVPRFGLGSIDVSHECNLRCEHCYFFEQDWSREWPISRWEQHFHELRAQGFPFLQCTFVGGEPLLRPEIVDLGRKWFQKCWVVTNGTIELPSWKDVTFYVSVDGTRDHCEAIRGKGIYERIKKHIQRRDVTIRTATVITKGNHACLEELVAEMYETPVQTSTPPSRGSTRTSGPGSSCGTASSTGCCASGPTTATSSSPPRASSS
jgi:sulfatase maturation enzyme AslB (radical SAM superfamily)